MALSYWEYKTWFTNVDFTIVGSGITGLSCALELREIYPKAKILILERGAMPQGASTKNAGFACFGSVSELLADLKTHTEDELLNLVEMRIKGLEVLKKRLGEQAIGFKKHGGYELFFRNQQDLYETCLDSVERVNRLLQPLFNDAIFSIKSNAQNFGNIQPKLVFNKEEGELDTGNMMRALVNLAQHHNIQILNNCTVENYTDLGDTVVLKTSLAEFKTRKLFIATNGFAHQLGVLNVEPARNQVLVTKPIKNLRLRGTYHLDEGYTYFRTIDDRILLGGGRNLDLKGEQTDSFGTTTQIQQYLERILAETILPGRCFEIEHRWSGILGVGDQKKPLLKTLSANVFCGVRLGGMGIAIGSLVGKKLAGLVKN
ncbi:MAG: FAD-dependent oxidoreductase [Leeuwenhoekiella sp.]|nr:MAG: FAD-dependent oxidoreductase [Leeuwenhoekiella sp.]